MFSHLVDRSAGYSCALNLPSDYCCNIQQPATAMHHLFPCAQYRHSLRKSQPNSTTTQDTTVLLSHLSFQQVYHILILTRYSLGNFGATNPPYFYSWDGFPSLLAAFSQFIRLFPYTLWSHS